MGNNKKVFLAYLTGLFSVKDAILNCSMESIIKDLYITDEVKENLIGDQNTLNIILKLAINYGKGNCENLMVYAKKLKLI